LTASPASISIRSVESLCSGSQIPSATTKAKQQKQQQNKRKRNVAET